MKKVHLDILSCFPYILLQKNRMHSLHLDIVDSRAFIIVIIFFLFEKHNVTRSKS